MVFSLLSTKWYPVLFDTPLNAVRMVAFWLTVAIAIAFVLCALLLKGELRTKFFKTATVAVITYAVTVGIFLLTLSFVEDGLVAILFAPMLILMVAVAASAFTLYLKRNKITYIVCGCITGAALIAALVCMGFHFASGDAADLNWLEGNDVVNQIGLYVGAVLAIGVLLFVTFFFGRKDKRGFDSKSIAYAAVCIAMSFALSYLRVVKMPQGGSITIASLLPLMIYAYMFGIKKGVFAGFIYGLLQALQSPTILHPAQFLLDYPVAFACIGLAGLFANFKPLEKLPQVQFLIGGVIAGLGRFVMHFLSGTFAFGSFAGEGQPAWLYSLIYQSGYVLPDIAITIAVGVIVLCFPSVAKLVRKFHQTDKPATETVTAEQ